MKASMETAETPLLARNWCSKNNDNFVLGSHRRSKRHTATPMAAAIKKTPRDKQYTVKKFITLLNNHNYSQLLCI